MRTSLLPLAFLLVASSALAEGDVTGTYEVKYDEVSNMCTDIGMSMSRGTLKIDKKKDNLVLEIPQVPLMQGPNGKGGKIKAQSRMAPSAIAGVDGKFSVAGRASDDVLQLVFVAEYYVKGKPHCTQSWNISGLKKK